MSNYLAIATVTAALQNLLIKHVKPDMYGTSITTQRPEAPSGDVVGPGVNIYMYQATPNQAWRNKDLRTRRPKGDLIKHGLAALDLNYLFSFYGDETQLVPQRLLGSTIRTLVDYPLLTHEMIRNGIDSSRVQDLETSTLEDQVQLVRFIPSSMTTEDLSRIWSTFFQVPYSLSFAYQATAVLMQGNKAGKASLPVRRRMASVTQNRPVVERIEQQPLEQPLTLSSSLIIHGRQLMGGARTEVRLGNSQIVPKAIQETQLLVQFSELGDEAIEALRPGVQGLQVVQTSMPAPGSVWEPAIESNVMPVVLCPTIVEDGITIVSLDGEFRGDAYTGIVSVKLDLSVSLQQRAYLMLNRMTGEGTQTYIFRAQRRQEDTRLLSFSIDNVDKGDFLTRVQIDGAESPLVDDDERFTGPLLSID